MVGRHLIVALALGVGVLGYPAFATDAAGPEALPSITAKERLSSKAADQQRVNDCKVPPALRGASRRPDCPQRPSDRPRQ